MRADCGKDQVSQYEISLRMRHTITRTHWLFYLPLLLTLALLIPAQPAQTSGPPPLVKMQIPYQQREELARLEGAGVDIWEVHPGYAIAVVQEGQTASAHREVDP